MLYKRMNSLKCCIDILYFFIAVSALLEHILCGVSYSTAVVGSQSYASSAIQRSTSEDNRRMLSVVGIYKIDALPLVWLGKNPFICTRCWLGGSMRDSSVHNRVLGASGDLLSYLRKIG